MPQGNPMAYMAPAEAQRQEALSRQQPSQDLTAMIAQMLQMGSGPNPNAPMTPAESQRQQAMGNQAAPQQGMQEGEPQPLSPEEVQAVVQSVEQMGAEQGIPPQQAGGQVEAQVMEDDEGSEQHTPKSDAQDVADASDAATNAEDVGGTYTVKRGDNLWNIAKRFLGDPQLYQQIAQMNNIPDPNMIQPGMKIQLPPSQNMPERNPNAA